MTYNIISSGSKGNATVINKVILIDCGVPFKALLQYYRDIQLVLLTHIHGDHFNKATIRKLALERPTLRFGCCEWLVGELLKCDVKNTQIDVYTPESLFDYGSFKIKPSLLLHNVSNCGYHVFFVNYKLFYATDTNSLNGIESPDYDLYMVEANYSEPEILERIKEKESQGLHCYEYDVLKNHLSLEKCNDWLYRNLGDKSEYIYMHQHEN